MSSASLCWNCGEPWHNGDCDPYALAHRKAEAHLRNAAAQLEQDLRPFVGFNLSGHRNGVWVVRTPKGAELKAETPATLLDLVRKAAGKARAPAQGGFGW